MHAMNGAQLGSKQVVVRLHEPKQLRQEKLAQRFSHTHSPHHHSYNGHPRNSSGATSPTASEGGESYIGGWGSAMNSPRQRSSGLGSPVGGQVGAGASVGYYGERPERGRRGSGSYYNVGFSRACPTPEADQWYDHQAALSGTLNLPMRYDDLAALSPVVRKEVLTGELSRRVKAMETVPPHTVDTLVDALVSLSLSEVVQGIHDPQKLAEQVQTLQARKASSSTTARAAPEPARASPEKSQSRSPSTSASQDSRLLDPNALNATASAPEHPSTPISVSASLSTPPRTSSPSGSVPPTSERDRMLAAVARFESGPGRQGELTDLLMSLPKRERAMCLFNAEVLRAKIADAKMVLDSDDAEDGQGLGKEETRSVKSAPVPETPVTPQAKKTSSSVAGLEDSPQTPDLSSRGPSAAASPVPGTPGSGGVTTTQYTIASLAKLPAAEIVRIAQGASATGVPLPKADPLVVKATDEFVDTLVDKPMQMQKQQLGDKL